jgi:hypothetical protein
MFRSAGSREQRSFIGRATGGVTLTGALTLAAASPEIILNKSSKVSQANYIQGQIGSVPRWIMAIGDSSSESGGNAGSDFTIFRYSDAGAYIDAPFNIHRATGNVAVNNLSVNGPTAVGGNGINYLNTIPGHYIGFGWNGSQLGAWVDGSLVISSISDARIKNVIGEYSSGLSEIEKLRPVHYMLKGNDTPEPHPEGETAPYSNSLHHQAAIDGHELIGLVAQECEDVLPEIVKYQSGYIDGVQVDDIRGLDLQPLTFALINAVKELSARVKALEAAAARERTL